MKHYLLGRARNARVQFFRYFFVGGSSALLDLFIFTLLTVVFDMQYLLAAAIGYGCGLAWNHLLSVLWVFESKHTRWKEISMVLGIALGGLLWTELILYMLVDMVGMHSLLAKIISQWLVLIWNFSMRKWLVFH